MDRSQRYCLIICLFRLAAGGATMRTKSAAVAKLRQEAKLAGVSYVAVVNVELQHW